MLKKILRRLLSYFYKVDVKGIEHYATAGERVLIVANHTSFLDAVLLAAFLPDKLSFAINTQIANCWYLRPFLSMVNVFKMDPSNPLSLKSLIRFLKNDNKIVIFPEGRITVTGSLMKIYYGPGMVADRAGARVLPIRIDGAQYTPFSRLRGRVRLRWFPKIDITILPSRKISAPEDVRGRERRKFSGQALSDIMSEMMFATSNYKRTLFQAVLDAKRIHGGKHVIAEDVERKPLTYQQLITRAFVLGKAMSKETQKGEYVGILLPNMISTVVTFMAMHAHGRVPAMLNFSVGTKGMLAACETANIKTIYTSRRFIEFAKLSPVIEQLASLCKVIYLEDVANKIGLFDKVGGFLAARFAQASYSQTAGNITPNDPAVVLFTSGSEGVPKGVVLSHKNLLANSVQLSTRVDFSSQDIILNALPMFHSFGLSAGTLLPLIAGVKVFFYPSPLHYRIIPEIAYDINATIMFGTNTFLAGYARFAHPYDFYSMRYVFAGAEKLHEETRRIWGEKFGVRILEGYGATETSPALTTNTPMDNKPGTVGRLLPGIEYIIDPVPGVAEGGRLYVKGPNVMLGYLLHEHPGKLQPPQAAPGEGWYDTGDIVEIDKEGFITIKGRAKRFAKIAGEMVSLAAVEELATRTWPGQHAVVTVPDKRKGEQLVLVTDQKDASRTDISAQAKEEGIGELNVPRKIVIQKNIPLLGTGKTDYPAVQSIVEKELAL